MPHDLVEYYKQQLVPIHVRYTKLPVSQYEIYSAFLIDIAGYWWLLTAGHCIAEIEAMRSAGYSASISLLDTLRADSKFDHPIPYGYDPELAYHKGKCRESGAASM